MKHHIDKIDSNVLYIEQSIYQNLNDIAAKIHNQYRFTEQSVMFDFNPHTYQIHMQVQENIPQDGSVPGRYSQIAVPRWFNLPLKVPDFLATQNVNNLLALFHFNVGDCRVVPSTHIIDYHKQKIDVDRQCYYIEVNCSSVDEAKKRALVLAYLTYDVREHNFVRLTTGYMMANAHLMNKMYKIFDTHGIDFIDKEQGLDLKSLIATQERQQHGGFLCSDKDQNEMRYHDRYKTMLFNDRLVHMTIRDDHEERLMDREQIQLASRIDIENSNAASKT